MLLASDGLLAHSRLANINNTAGIKMEREAKHCRRRMHAGFCLLWRIMIYVKEYYQVVVCL